MCFYLVVSAGRIVVPLVSRCLSGRSFEDGRPTVVLGRRLILRMPSSGQRTASGTAAKPVEKTASYFGCILFVKKCNLLVSQVKSLVHAMDKLKVSDHLLCLVQV